jgi:hypothetical protein
MSWALASAASEPVRLNSANWAWAALAASRISFRLFLAFAAPSLSASVTSGTSPPGLAPGLVFGLPVPDVPPMSSRVSSRMIRSCESWALPAASSAFSSFSRIWRASRSCGTPVWSCIAQTARWRAISACCSLTTASAFEINWSRSRLRAAARSSDAPISSCVMPFIRSCCCLNSSWIGIAALVSRVSRT